MADIYFHDALTLPQDSIYHIALYTDYNQRRNMTHSWEQNFAAILPSFKFQA